MSVRMVVSDVFARKAVNAFSPFVFPCAMSPLLMSFVSVGRSLPSGMGEG